VSSGGQGVRRPRPDRGKCTMRQRPRRAVFGPLAGMGAKRQAKAHRGRPPNPPPAPRTAPYRVLARPPAAQQTAWKGRLNFLYPLSLKQR
jgi:hypothetical protein